MGNVLYGCVYSPIPVSRTAPPFFRYPLPAWVGVGVRSHTLRQQQHRHGAEGLI